MTKKRHTENNQERLIFFFQLLAFISKTEDGTNSESCMLNFPDCWA